MRGCFCMDHPSVWSSSPVVSNNLKCDELRTCTSLPLSLRGMIKDSILLIEHSHQSLLSSPLRLMWTLFLHSAYDSVVTHTYEAAHTVVHDVKPHCPHSFCVPADVFVLWFTLKLISSFPSQLCTNSPAKRTNTTETRLDIFISTWTAVDQSNPSWSTATWQVTHTLSQSMLRSIEIYIIGDDGCSSSSFSNPLSFSFSFSSCSNLFLSLLLFSIDGSLLFLLSDNALCHSCLNMNSDDSPLIIT